MGYVLGDGPAKLTEAQMRPGRCLSRLGERAQNRNLLGSLLSKKMPSIRAGHA